jgi:hypothetical protein
MQEYERSIFNLVVTGSLVALGKLMVGCERLTVRLICGRAILGSATSLLAGVVLLNIPNIPPLALVSIGSGLGIVGQQVIEKLLRAKFNKVIVDRRSKK